MTLSAYLAKPKAGSLKSAWEEDFYALVEKEFENAVNVYEIDEEFPRASKKYVKRTVRIDKVVDAVTGAVQTDDWRKLLFRTPDRKPKIGEMFYFFDNYWIAVNTENTASVTSTAIVRRCNNVLRWMDKSGEIYEEYCIMPVMIQENRDYATSGTAFVGPSGFMEIISQFNERTNKIYPNQRFLFGNPDNWTAYRTLGAGLNSINRTSTTDPYSAGILRLSVLANYVNPEMDDIVYGIADKNQFDYRIILDTSSISGTIGQKIQLKYQVLKGDKIVDKIPYFYAENGEICDVDKTGVLTLKNNGKTQIFVSLTKIFDEDTKIFDDKTNYFGNIVSCDIKVTSLPSYNIEFVLSPIETNILELETNTYSINVYENGINTEETLSFIVNTESIPAINYTFTELDRNSFSITNNIRYLDNDLIIRCYSAKHDTSKDFAFKLKGGW